MEANLMSLREAARQTGISPRTLRDWLERSGLVLPAVRRGSKLVISPGDLERAMRAHPPAPADAASGGTQGLKVMCAWHPQYFGTQLVLREGPPGRVSHGVCEQCRKKAFP